MHPFDAASFFLSATPAEAGESFEPPQQEVDVVGAASSPSPSDGTRADGENAGNTCHGCRGRPKAYCAHRRGLVCPGHVKSPHVPASGQHCSSARQQTTLAASASTTAAAVDVVEPIPKRPRRTALPSVAAAALTTTSSVDQPMATAATTTTALDRFAREVSLDAVFRRVRLGGPEPEVAYYTTVTIAGHVFRGVLYDAGRGPHSGSSTAAASDTDGSGGEVSSLSTSGGGGSCCCCLDLTLGL